MKTIGTLCLLAGIFMLAGCDEAPKSKIKNPMAGQVEALEKAKDVERQLLEADIKKRKAIDDMSK